MLLNELTIKQANEGLKKKDFSSVDLAKACFDRIKKTDDKIKAFVTLTEDLAIKQAEAADRAKDFSQPLAGIPAAIKDIFCIEDIRTTAASKILENYIAPYTATTVKKLLSAGSAVLGKTNMDEFACGSSTETSHFGQTKNPWDLKRVPGGSSGGSAAAVAADQCLYALGTDTGGSIRQPASLCNIVGIKPTYGRVSRYGVIAMASSLDQVGPMTKTVEDAAIVLEQLAGSDKNDSTTVNHEVPKYSELIKKGIKGLKIGVPKEFFVSGTDPAVEKTVKQAIAKLEELGAKITEVSLPHVKYGLAVYYILMPSELSANLARYDGVRYGFSAKAESLLENYLQTRAQGFGPEIRRRIMLGTYSLSAGYYDAYYLKAQKVRTLVKQDFDQALAEVDCLVTPTSPTVAFKFGEKVDDPLTMYLSDIFTVSINIAGVPAISIPCGFAKPKDGKTEMPVGLQIIGNHFAEATILQAAYNYEQATEWHKQKPSL
ncbi:MAG: Asp-tRNA(Asn)/Glu-tRNA(Gln) amidotransferase subunit GatA [Patescibacteria group bacterium]|jgi:aspartyl-tRNA(Asn)/glutamyl-tRNA(Gln) amidotransferase subunit A